ncbi:hypothetical protein B9Q01_03395 [Candidatus Marsarchaeota G1 archaeon OSP_D]|jgi:protease II|uniref:Peptidase S9 prolyl oligopeptidase catalytic domain-containing protein n=5 Tax=Candidatus Marsarchaeota TaxID=1978152 RepID=A0A2R6AE83_9ARCH|nr:MAG: hypothetical protein B9Q01_03395 [Candidatus Marsarchaeota G1 archaeon OSP_D]PSN84690.1 MAG: hypothetical protein B9Q02_09195 [Candidatus Marsarchaeota G1 archaeon BE_D]PSN87442.1 MAG: hypothetical protein B9Q00_08830 [Candidatus Marsarchaeota G1 archaeon OSP_C]PSO03659.1 MAG: hypothetical protein B9Q10_00195 [Candidatus Marsarchaeota G2 archaeon ECH_B_SAG-E12]
MLEHYDIVRFFSFRSAHSAVYDGRFVYYVSDASGSPELWRTTLECEHEQLTFLGGVSNPKAQNGRVVFQYDPVGSEQFKLLCVDQTGKVSVVKEHKHAIFRLGDFKAGVLAYASNVRDRRFFDTYILAKEEKMVFECDGTSQPHALSDDGTKLLLTVMNTNLDSSLFLVDLQSGDKKELLPHQDETTFSSPTFGDDGLIYVCTNYQDEFLQPCAINPVTGEHKILQKENYDCELIAKKGDCVAYTRNVEGYSELHVVKAGTQTKKFFEGTISELKFLSSELCITLSTYDSNTNVYILKDSLKRVTHASRGYYGEVVKPQLVRYTSFDGLSIPAFVYIPKTEKPESGYPTIVYVHGGPESQKRVEYDAQIQFFVYKGYAVVTPNVRGSTGYGKRYTHLDDVEKRLDSVKDLVSLVEWMKRDGRFDTKRVCIMGRSYGGYMVLAALAFYPELWKCGVEAVGIANLETFLKNTAPWRRKLRECEYGSLENHLEILRKLSPIHYVERINAPLLVQHGKNDPRVPFSESLEIVQQIKNRGGVAELVTFDDEGHSNQNIRNRIEWAKSVVRFLERYL